jgi:tetratricopeptide (TPR) repeat protein
MSLKNPYEFRTPIRERHRLVGRERELAVIRDAFESTLEDRGSHVTIEGPPRRGKTSLLNVAALEAEDLGLLPARLDISTLLFDSDLGFFRALIDAVVVALVSRCEITTPEDRYAACVGDIGGGEKSRSEDSEAPVPVIRGPLFSCSGMTTLSPPLLRRDFDRAVEHATGLGFRGVAFLLDDAHYLFEQADHAVLELFDGLLRAGGTWSFVLAGNSPMRPLMREHSFNLYQRFMPLRLEPILDIFEVRHLLLGPIDRSDVAASLDMDTAFDLMLISGIGEPYWMTVGAHGMWDEGEGEKLELTTSIIRTLTLVQKQAARDPDSHGDSLKRMKAIDEMSDELVQSASRLAPYHAMTVAEYVLSTRLSDLASDKSIDEDLDSAIKATKKWMDELVSAGLLDRTDDRFNVAGDIRVQTYLRYEAARRAGGQPIRALGHSSYGTAAAPSWLERLAHDMTTVVDTGLIATTLETGEVGDESVEEPLREIQAAGDERDPVRAAESGFLPSAFSMPPPGEVGLHTSGLSYVGIVFSVGIDSEFTLVSQRVNCGWLRWNSSEISAQDCALRVQEWLADHTTELAEYRLRVEKVVAGTMDQELAEQVVALMAPWTISGFVIDLFQAKRLLPAAEYLRRIVKALERGLEASSRHVDGADLADAYIRLGFISALLRRPEDAWAALKRSEELQNEHGNAGHALIDRVLLEYNLAHVRALRGEFAAAADGAKRAAELASDETSGTTFLLLHLPVPPTWSEPDPIWNTATVPGKSVASTALAQARCYEALAGKYSKSEFDDVASTFTEPGLAALRILGWTWLTRFNDPTKARSAFEQAASLNEADDIVKSELEFARRASGAANGENE